MLATSGLAHRTTMMYFRYTWMTSFQDHVHDSGDCQFGTPLGLRLLRCTSKSHANWDTSVGYVLCTANSTFTIPTSGIFMKIPRRYCIRILRLPLPPECFSWGHQNQGKFLVGTAWGYCAFRCHRRASHESTRPRQTPGWHCERR